MTELEKSFMEVGRRYMSKHMDTPDNEDVRGIDRRWDAFITCLLQMMAQTKVGENTTEHIDGMIRNAFGFSKIITERYDRMLAEEKLGLNTAGRSPE